MIELESSEMGEGVDEGKWSSSVSHWLKARPCGDAVGSAIFLSAAALGGAVDDERARYEEAIFFAGRDGCSKPPEQPWVGVTTAEGRRERGGVQLQGRVNGEGYHRELAVSVTGGRDADWEGGACGIAVVWTMPSTVLADSFQVTRARKISLCPCFSPDAFISPFLSGMQGPQMCVVSICCGVLCGLAFFQQQSSLGFIYGYLLAFFFSDQV